MDVCGTQWGTARGSNIHKVSGAISKARDWIKDKFGVSRHALIKSMNQKIN